VGKLKLTKKNNSRSKFGGELVGRYKANQNLKELGLLIVQKKRKMKEFLKVFRG